VVISPTILLCDDAEGFRVMLGTMLSDAGLDVSVACTWDDAVTRATQRQPDAILVDLWMPTYDPALLRGLRACSPGSAVVVVSALSIERSALAVSGIEGISAVVSKRDRPEVIVAAVIDALRQSGSREPSIARLRAEAARASERLSIYRHKTVLGSGDRQVLAEHQRVARTARDRLRHASRRASSPEG
jgi:DNA-binding response OmpR family regulator